MRSASLRWKVETMATIEQRLSALEAKRIGRRPDDPRQAAMGRLFVALREALPDDEPEYITTGFARRAVYSSTHQSHMDKVRALAGRIAAGEVSEGDRSLLEALPQDAALDMPASEFITLIAGIDMLY